MSIIVSPPSVYEMHHEILGKFLHIKVLQQETHVLVVEVRNTIGVRRQGKSDILIKSLRDLEIFSRHKHLQFNRIQ
jgi:hypothetical protein